MADNPGSCLCGTIRWVIDAEPTLMSNCHCSMCRKAHGAAFRSRAGVRTSDFRWVQGEELVTWYETSQGTHRGFCRVCGAKLLSRFDFEPKWHGLPLGALDDDPGVRPGMQVVVAHKAPWFEISDDLPQHPEWPPR
jgi:hypothetical protein